MPFWAIYSTDPETPGALREIVNAPRSLEELKAEGLGQAFFGQDPPDMAEVEWSSTRLTFVGRQWDRLAFAPLFARLDGLDRATAHLPDVDGLLAYLLESDVGEAAEVAATSGFGDRLRAAEAEIARLTQPREGWVSRMKSRLRREGRV